MTMRYRIKFETYNDADPDRTIKSTEVLDASLLKPTNILDYGIGQATQIELIQVVQDNVLSEKTKLFINTGGECPKCSTQFSKYGTSSSRFFDIYTDHKVKIQRLRCENCKYEAPRSIKGILRADVSGDLKKIQATLGAEHTYREAKNILSLFSGVEREINNHDRIKHTTETVGQASQTLDREAKEMVANENAKNLILNVDGGHIKTTEETRSIEAMTAVIYKPEAIKPNKNDTRNTLISKHCAASVKNDNQAEMISNTIVAALKQGMCKDTHITALSDGAKNCWNVIEAMTPFCKTITCILDWFHMAMKIENISLPKNLKEKLEKVKWHLWRGKVSNALTRLDQLIELAKNGSIDKLKKFKSYILNNKEKIVDYETRQDNGQVFTSNLAESTVESLINQRCKGHQHMRWSREGLDPVLQLRATIHSNDWDFKWKDAVLNAV